MQITKRRKREIDDWIERYNIYDYFSETYIDKWILIGYSRDEKIYKKIIR